MSLPSLLLHVCGWSFALRGRVILLSRSVCVFTFREKGPGLMGVVTPRGFLLVVGPCRLFQFSWDLSRTLRVLRIGVDRSQIGAWESPTVPGKECSLPKCTVGEFPPLHVSHLLSRARVQLRGHLLHVFVRSSRASSTSTLRHHFPTTRSRRARPTEASDSPQATKCGKSQLLEG